MTLSMYRLTWRLPLAGLVVFSHLQFSQIRGRQPYLIVRNILYVITKLNSSLDLVRVIHSMSHDEGRGGSWRVQRLLHGAPGLRVTASCRAVGDHPRGDDSTDLPVGSIIAPGVCDAPS